MDDKTLGENLARARGSMTQAELGTKMAKRGWKWSQATVWSTEHAKRPLKVAELIDLADLLGTDVVDLLSDPPTTELGERIEADTQRLREASLALIDTIQDWLKVRATAWDPEVATPAEIEELGKRYWEYRDKYNGIYDLSNMLVLAAHEAAEDRAASPEGLILHGRTHRGKVERKEVEAFIEMHTGFTPTGPETEAETSEG